MPVTHKNVLITGMHRSGTSAVADVLRRAGLFGGEDADFMPATPDNPAGYWEVEGIRQFNDRLLRSLGWSWDAPDAIPPTVAPARPAAIEEGRSLIEERVARRYPFFVKDPRLSLLLPWWRQILPERFVTVVVLRPPGEVASSLASRDGFPVALGAALWSAYHRHLAAGLTGLRVLVVDYVALVADPPAIVPQVLRELERLGVRGLHDQVSAVSAVRPSLRRATQPWVTEAEPWVAGVERVHATWRGSAAQAIKRFRPGASSNGAMGSRPPRRSPQPTGRTGAHDRCGGGRGGGECAG